MTTHTLLISTDSITFRDRVEQRLMDSEFITDYNFTALKGKTLLKIKSEAKNSFQKAKEIVYSSGFYAKRKRNILSAMLLM